MEGLNVHAIMASIGTGSLTCELHQLAYYLGWPKCGPSIHRHHMVNRSKMERSPAALDFAEANDHIWLADVCDVHNVDRYADNPHAQAWLLRKRIQVFGKQYVKSLWDEWISLFKEPWPEMEMLAILAELPETPHEWGYMPP